MKVHVWDGINVKWSTGVCIFVEIMKGLLYVQILGSTLLSFLLDVFPNGHCFMQDNDPIHTSRLALQFMHDNNVQLWKMPAVSPDANPIEKFVARAEGVYSVRG